jgi:hypothetical protein
MTPSPALMNAPGGLGLRVNPPVPVPVSPDMAFRDVDPVLMAGVVLSAGGAALWSVLFLRNLSRTRPVEVPAAAPHQDLSGDLPPAVVNLLSNGWKVTEDAAVSTLIDLAARRYLEFRQPGNEPLQTTIHVREPAPEGLTPYERAILSRVTGLAVGGTVPLTAITFRDRNEAKQFRARLSRQIVADARSRGVCRRRFSRAVVSTLLTAGAVC